MTSDLGTVHVGEGEGGGLLVFGETVTRRVASERTGGAYALFEVVLQPGRGVPLHIHHREDECLYMVEGTLSFSIAGRSHRSSRGDLLYVAKGTLHAYENVAATVGKMLVWQTPGGLSERFYEELATRAGSSNLPRTDGLMNDSTTTTDIAARYGIEIVLPEEQGR